jgi:16S rRNA (guanine527-N7)-methyltransferase
VPDRPEPEPAPASVPEPWLPAASALFGERLDQARRYAELLATDGLTRGLLGPREGERLWDRHLLNSAALAALVPDAARVVDVGSGAGLPGIPLALARPDVRVVLLEPLLRRATFLEEVVASLGLTEQVAVVRGRAPEDAAALPFHPDCVTARAVAPLDRLVSWTMPLVSRSGLLLALRGASAADEVRASAAAIRREAGSEAEVLHVGAELLAEPVTVVRVVKQTADASAAAPPRRAPGRRRPPRPRRSTSS